MKMKAKIFWVIMIIIGIILAIYHLFTKPYSIFKIVFEIITIVVMSFVAWNEIDEIKTHFKDKH